MAQQTLQAPLATRLGFQLQRMRKEEQILRETFPEYAAYAAQNRRVIPGVY